MMLRGPRWALLALIVGVLPSSLAPSGAKLAFCRIQERFLWHGELDDPCPVAGGRCPLPSGESPRPCCSRRPTKGPAWSPTAGACCEEVAQLRRDVRDEPPVAPLTGCARIFSLLEVRDSREPSAGCAPRPRGGPDPPHSEPSAFRFRPLLR